ncbi:hypothetical protein T08_11606 [Trichinella sp. T8]|nr:hypothetical protein T08_11606 [Trichinella sp. T8]
MPKCVKRNSTFESSTVKITLRCADRRRENIFNPLQNCLIFNPQMDCWRHVRFWVPGVTLPPLEKHFYVAEKMQQSNLRNSVDLRLFWNGRLIMAIFTKEMIIILVESSYPKFGMNHNI